MKAFIAVGQAMLVAGLVVVLLVHTAAAQDEDPGHSAHGGVMVFTTRALPAIKRIDQADRVFYLDGAETALRTLSFANPGTEARARAMASDALQTPAGKAAIETLQHVGEGVSLAWQHGIQKLPAILVGGDRVVYGVFDVGQARALIQEDVDHER